MPVVDDLCIIFVLLGTEMHHYMLSQTLEFLMRNPQFLWVVFLWVCVCAHMWTCLWTVCKVIIGCQPEESSSTLFFLSQCRLFLTWSMSNRLGWLAGEPNSPISFCFLSVWIRSTFRYWVSDALHSLCLHRKNYQWPFSLALIFL